MRVSLETLIYVTNCIRWRRQPGLMVCPSCGSAAATLIDRKTWLTELARCGHCHLLYRRPQAPEGYSAAFYQKQYRSPFSTELPSRAALASMVRSGFRSTAKNLSDKIEILRTLGLERGARVLDYGASWGYGVWQLRAAGYDAEGFEISRQRADYGTANLGIVVASDDSRLRTETYDAVFSNHVLEHTTDPSASLAHMATMLKPKGLLVGFVPNGSEECRLAHPSRYHCNWGRLHPVYINREFCERELAGTPYWIASKAYEARIDHGRLRRWNRADQVVGDMRENEMMFVSVRTPAPDVASQGEIEQRANPGDPDR